MNSAPPAAAPPQPRHRAVAAAVLALGLVSYSAIWAANAWLTDDPFISFRTLEQLLAGNGLRFNPHERVQAFTHPLWLGLLLLPRLAGMALPAAALAVSWLLALGLLGLLWRLARGSPWRWAAAAALAATSRTLLDFSSSGLETPLSVLLVVTLAVGALAAPAVRPLHLFLLGAALLLTRHDLLPLLLPPLTVLATDARQRGRALLAPALAGLSPLVAWSLFALAYYGSPLPNTWLAKLGSGVPAAELAGQGLTYLRVSLLWDPLLLPLLVGGAVAAVRGGRGARALGLGAALQVIYLTAIGGDFMAGRFLVPVAALALALVTHALPTHGWARAVLPATVLFALAWPASPLRTGRDHQPAWRLGAAGRAGIVDEKGNAPGSEWLRERWRTGWPPPATAPAGAPRASGVLGRPGYYAAPAQILVDPFALADPLLARLPAERPWQIGHFRRALPAGYLASLASGENRITDPALARLYDEVRVVAGGDLWRGERWRAIGRLAVRPRAAAGVGTRCPQLVLSGAPAAGARRLAVRSAGTQKQASWHLAGSLPLGAAAAAWRLRAVGEPAPIAGTLRCRARAGAAPLDFELRLDYADAAAAAALGPESPALELVGPPEH